MGFLSNLIHPCCLDENVAEPGRPNFKTSPLSSVVLMLTCAPGAWRASKSQSLVMKIDYIPQLMWLTVASSSKFMLRPLCWLYCILTEFCIWNGDVWCIVPHHLPLMILPKFPSCFPKTSFPWLTVICCIFQVSVWNKYTISLTPASMAYTLEIRDFKIFFGVDRKIVHAVW